jgi:hypothetical protein
MNKTILWPILVFLVFIFTPTTNAQQSTENKWEQEIQQFEKSDKKNPPPKEQFFLSAVHRSECGKA